MCCGVEGFDGYKVWISQNRNFNSQTQVPLSCCQRIWTSGQFGNSGMNLPNTNMMNPMMPMNPMNSMNPMQMSNNAQVR